MNNDPYLGIKRPMALYEPRKIIIDSNRYINIQLYEKNRIKYYEVVFYDNGKEIFLGNYYKDDSIFEVSYKNGKVLIHNDEFIQEIRKVQIIEVFALYDVCDGIFYYCTEEEAIKVFDERLDTSSLKRKNNKLLRNDFRKKFSSSNVDSDEIYGESDTCEDSNIIKFRR